MALRIMLYCYGLLNKEAVQSIIFPVCMTKKYTFLPV